MDATKKKKIPEGYFSRINRIMGRVVSARGLPNFDFMSKSDPYCVIRGIRSNNHLVNIFMTSVKDNTLSPVWEEEFDFEVPKNLGSSEIVGLKITMFDAEDGVTNFLGSDDFMGGTDIDISNAQTGRMISYDLELGGVAVSKAKGKKPRLNMVLTIYREIVPIPPTPMQLLTASLHTLTYTREVLCRVWGATGLRNAEILSLSDPMCIVSVVLLSGQQKEVHRTPPVQDNLDPIWDDEFSVKFSIHEQPIMLKFQVVHSDSSSSSSEVLGTALLPFTNCFGENSGKRLALRGMHYQEKLSKKRSSVGSMVGQLRKQMTKEMHQAELTRGQKIQAAVRTVRDTLFMRQSQDQNANCQLMVDVRVRQKNEKMPFVDIFEKAVDVADEDDVELCLADESWARSDFSVPSQLLQKGRPPRGQLSGIDRIVCVYGWIHGASSLPTADLTGKSDPYCLVEAVSRLGERFPVHTTRVIPSNLCPPWDEAFFYMVPEHIEIARLAYSIFDKDVGFAALMSGSDEFLGRASTDLSTLCSGECSHEHIPLVGCSIESSEAVTTGFRRASSIEVEVYVERRIKPVYGYVAKGQFKVLPRRKHAVTESEEHKYFLDLSQTVDAPPEVEVVAPEVLKHYATGTLIQAARDKKTKKNQMLMDSAWFHSPPLRRKALPEQKEQEDSPNKPKDPGRDDVQLYELRPDLDPDFSVRCPLTRPQSLPALSTRFGVPANVFQETQRRGQVAVANQKTLAESLSFSEESFRMVSTSLQSIQHRPMLSELSHHELNESFVESTQSVLHRRAPPAALSTL